MSLFASKPRRRALLDLFILFHIVSVTSWSLPPPLQPDGIRHFTRLIGPYMLGSGLWQGWDMFAPNPLSTVIDLEAEVTFRDGTRETWVFPRMEEMSYWERYRKERYRTWRGRLRMEKWSAAWPDTARYVARLHDRPEKPPVSVNLKRRWGSIPPPSERWLQTARPAIPLSAAETFFSYEVRPGDLP